MSGAAMMAMGARGFAPVTNTYNVAGTFTETIPPGATTLVLEGWGAGAIGGAAPITFGGGGGGGGGYSRVSLAVTTKVGQTFIVIVGTEGNGIPTRTMINPGSVTGFTSILCGTGVKGGDGGAGAGGTGGAGGTATNANSGAVNSNGGAGAVGQNGFVGGAGGTSHAGVNGGPFGTGGNGFVSGGPPTNGQNGGAVFAYT